MTGSGCIPQSGFESSLESEEIESDNVLVLQPPDLWSQGAPPDHSTPAPNSSAQSSSTGPAGSPSPQPYKASDSAIDCTIKPACQTFDVAKMDDKNTNSSSVTKSLPARAAMMSYKRKLGRWRNREHLPGSRDMSPVSVPPQDRKAQQPRHLNFKEEDEKETKEKVFRKSRRGVVPQKKKVPNILAEIKALVSMHFYTLCVL